MTDNTTTVPEPDGFAAQGDDSKSEKSRAAMVIGAVVVSVVVVVGVFAATRDNGYDGPINGDATTFDEFTTDFPDECVVSPQPQSESTAHNVYCTGRALGIPELPGHIAYQWQERMPDEDLLAEWGSDTCGLVSGRTIVDYYLPQQNDVVLNEVLQEFVNTVPQTFNGEVTVTEACP